MTRHSKPSALVKPHVANRVRINAGKWRSRVIEFPDAEGLRPTANRVRETLFNWLGQTLHEKRCLDLFAGSGALGFEAASRGAAEVVMVENNRAVMQALKSNQDKLLAVECRLVQQDVEKFLFGNQQKFDVVFLDPPFASGLLVTLLGQLQGHLSADGVVYAEWREPIVDVVSSSAKDCWRVVKQGKAGAVHFALLHFVKGEA